MVGYWACASEAGSTFGESISSCSGAGNVKPSKARVCLNEIGDLVKNR